jgi:molybdenum cofactor cytidylyltransferase
MEPDRTIDCVIPAAGRSQRMGQWKPLLPFGAATIIDTVVAAALAACARVILVAGYRGEELARRFEGRPRVLVVPNEAWERGMFSSVQRGAGAVGTARFFITPGDMPWIPSGVYAALAEAESLDVVVPTFGGRRGHPVLLSGNVRRSVLEADPATPAMRGIVARFPAREVPWKDDAILRDADTPEDLR